MALLQVSVPLLITQLFRETNTIVRCDGVWAVRDDGQTILVNIAGPDVPDGDVEVIAIIQRERTSVVFKPVDDMTTSFEPES